MAGSVVFRVFTETEGLDLSKLETAVKRVGSVTDFSYDASKKEVRVGYTGYAKDVKELKIAIEGQGLSCEAVNPARVVIRPVGAISKPDAALSAMKGVSGVLDTARDGNDLIAYSDLETLSLEALAKALEGAGVKCQFPSHEEVKIKYGASGDPKALKAELQKVRGVLRADIDSEGQCVKVLAAKGRVTRAAVKSIMDKHGFPEAK